MLLLICTSHILRWSINVNHWVPVVEGLFSKCDAVFEYYNQIMFGFYLGEGVEWELLFGQIVGYMAYHMLVIETVDLVCRHFYFIQQCSKCLTV